MCRSARVFISCLARARWQGMFSQMGLEIRIKGTSNYLDAQSLDDTELRDGEDTKLWCANWKKNFF